MLKLSGVSKRFDDTLALDAVDLVCERDRTTVLIGPSGCGKSTVLRLVVGLVAPDSGSVLVDGAPVTPENVLELRRRMGYVIQDGGLFPHLTAKENVTLLARHLERDEREIAARVDELCDLARFPTSGLERYPSELSGGQRQRVGLMRALFLDPDVLLLDEPLGALDPMVRADLQQDLRDVFRMRKKTVILVTHDMGEAAYLADGAVLLRDGRVVQIGSVRDLVERPVEPFVAEFVQAQRSPLEEYA